MGTFGSKKRRPFALGVEELESRRLLALPMPAHVVIVMEENRSYSEILGSPSAPYINSLAQHGASLTSMFAVEHPSQPSYLDFFAGSNQGVTDDSTPHTFSTANLGSELMAASLTFGGYSESMPSIGFTGDSDSTGTYARKHNPWVNFTNIPSADNLPFASFPASFDNLPTVSMVVPNLQDDMHDGSIGTGDTWLRNNLDSYVRWARTNNSLLIVTFDEDDDSENNRVATILLGPMVQSGQYSEPVNHFNLLRTIEDMYHLSRAGASDSSTPIADVWINPLSAPPSVATPASASLNTAGTQAQLGVLGADDSGENNLFYTWSVVSKPAGAADPSFSVNGTNAAKNAVATFSQASDTTPYVLRATITDQSGQAVSSDASVTVTPMETSIAVSPAIVSLAPGRSQLFAASARDQFGAPLATQPIIAWSLDASGVGSIVGGSGQYAAPLAGTGTATVWATGGGIGGSATVSVTTAAALAPVFAVNAGGAGAAAFAGDSAFSGGSVYPSTDDISTAGVSNPAPQAVYQSERYGNFSYTAARLTPGTSYTVRLHFAEIFWTSADDRLFNVQINGNQVLTDFDIFAEAGGADTAIVKQFTATADSAGKITISFISDVDNAKVSGIEILPTGPTPHAPTWSSTRMLLPSVVPGSSPSGGTVANLFGSLFRDVDGDGVGVAVTGLNAAGRGSWQYSTDVGGTWFDMGRVSTLAALLLDGNALLRFLPSARVPAGTVSLQVSAWDGHQGSATQGSVRGIGNLSGTGKTGGKTAFSTTRLTASCLVNTAPALGSAAGPALTAASKNHASRAFSVVFFLTGAPQSISDPDIGSLRGVAITGANGPGTWEYTANGRTWVRIATVPASLALLLPSNVLLRFVPGKKLTGAATLLYRAWDRTQGLAGHPIAMTGTGAATAFSDMEATLTLDVV